MPGGAPSGRASVSATSALAFEANHLSPQTRERGEGADVGAAGLLRHPLRALPQVLERGGGQPRQVAPAQRLVAEARQHPRRGVGHVHGAEQAELRLREEVGQRVLHDVRHAAGPAQHAVAVRHRGETEALEGQLLHRAVGRVEDDLVHAAAALVVGAQGGRMAVGRGRERVQLVAGDGTHLDQQWPRAREHLGLHHRGADELEIGIGDVEVEAARRRHAVLRRPRPRRRRQLEAHWSSSGSASMLARTIAYRRAPDASWRP